MKIMITGGAGFIGTHLVEQLLREYTEIEIVLVDCFVEQVHGSESYLSMPKGVKLLKQRVSKLTKNDIKDIDVVYYLAAETGTGQSNYEIMRYVQANELELAYLLQLIHESGSNVKQIILPSSRSVYGEGAYITGEGTRCFPSPRDVNDLSAGKFLPKFEGNEIIPVATKESDAFQVASIYAATKLNQENLLKCFCELNGIIFTIFRLQNVYGPGQSLRNPYTGIVSIFANQLRQNLAINIYEDGCTARDFIFVGDVATVMSRALKNERSYNQTINLGSGIAVQVKDLAKMLKDFLDSDSDVKITGDYRPGDIRCNFADLTVLHSIYPDYEPTSITNGLEEFVNWVVTMPVYADKTSTAYMEALGRNEKS